MSTIKIIPKTVRPQLSDASIARLARISELDGRGTSELGKVAIHEFIENKEKMYGIING